MRPEQMTAIDMAIRSILSAGRNGWLNISITTKDPLILPGEVKERLTAVLLHLARHGSAEGTDLLNGAPTEVFAQPTIDLQIACGMSPLDRLRAKGRLESVIEAELLAGVIVPREAVEWDTHREYNITVAA